MTDKQLRITNRNAKIVERYLELRSKKFEGKTQLYSDATILHKLSNEFYLSPSTIDDIIHGRKQYSWEKDNQKQKL